MAYAPLVLKHNTEIDSTDVSDQVISIKFMGTRDDVVIPATGGAAKSHAAGDADYSVEITLIQDVDSSAISEILFAALADADGTIEVSGTMRAGAVSASNPSYTADAVVTGWELGGGVNTVGQHTITMPCVARPVRGTGS
jgi:hypothetical protein